MFGTQKQTQRREMVERSQWIQSIHCKRKKQLKWMTCWRDGLKRDHLTGTGVLNQQNQDTANDWTMNLCLMGHGLRLSWNMLINWKCFFNEHTPVEWSFKNSVLMGLNATVLLSMYKLVENLAIGITFCCHICRLTHHVSILNYFCLALYRSPYSRPKDQLYQFQSGS